MPNKEEFMKYARKRLKEKANKTRRLIGEVTVTQIEGLERRSRGGWRAGQR